MEVNINRLNNAVHLEGKNERGLTISMDGSEKIGGQNLGASPMEVVLMGLGGCASMDVLSILEKMKQKVDTYHVHLDAKRDGENEPAVFTQIHIHWKVSGQVANDKLARAIELSMVKYCSVSKMLEKSAEITFSHTIID